MIDLRNGASILVSPEFAQLEDGHKSPKCKEKHWGKVIYIHPLGRFVVVEFSFPAGEIREAFTLSK